MNNIVMKLGGIVVVVLAGFAGLTGAVKRQDFKTCAQSGFCTRQRAHGQLADLGWSVDDSAERAEGGTGIETYAAIVSSVSVDTANGLFSVDVVGSTAQSLLSLKVAHLSTSSKDGSTIRVTLTEKNPLHPHFSLDSLLVVNNGSHAPFIATANALSFGLTNNLQLELNTNPLKLSIKDTSTQETILVFNGRSHLYVEHQRLQDAPALNVQERDSNQQEPIVQDGEQPLAPAELTEREKEIKRLKEELVKDLWEESFGGKQDSKPRGPQSAGFDLSFPHSAHLYGLPQHASSYALKPTRGPNAPYSDPYRLYNFDVFEYELDNPMALYGSVPFLLAHAATRSIGALWLNSAEMWVDVEEQPRAEGGSSTHWMAENGPIDLLIFVGKGPKEVGQMLTYFTGRPAMPQLFAVGYHQSRWNYLDEQDVAEVDAQFDVHEIPYDVLWLDIEHTDGKRYFTWDKVKFPHPDKMQQAISVKGRKMVTIIDPHLKQDDGYPVSKKAKDLGILVKNKDNNDFDGWCWPGTSYWIDYLNPEGRKFWAEQFKYENYHGSTPFLYTWNDMNEPSVFSGPEITMPKDNIHFGGAEHREVHNIYGSLQHRATAEGHLLRSGNTDRPFVLSRAFFIGTQRYGAIWTGDNTATWEHLAISVPMLLTIGVSGVTFCGADVGGFFGNPDADLLVRWYQTAAFQPFFRGHAHIDTKRREPWLFGEPYTGVIREAIRARYRLLPYIYTLFWESSQTGAPVMRSLMHEFPQDEATFSLEDAFMLGPALLVHPVVTKDATHVDVYLPPAAIWYDYDTFGRVTPGSTGPRAMVETPLEKLPVFLRGGSIVPRRDRVRRAAALGLRDPYTLVIALDVTGSARGEVYVDDGHSYGFEQKGEYVLADFVFQAGVLKGSAGRRVGRDGPVTKEVVEKLGARVERLVLVGLGTRVVKSVTVQGSGRRLEFMTQSVVSDESGKETVVIVKDPKVIVGEEWSIVVA
ncbi:glycosyl hydrolases family 31-domain-containing protein [Chytriomyces sp. MP71]|nr:glycosyl hydrolases family 31-domain-containing protein [Chytriomyces sp. MP71]